MLLTIGASLMPFKLTNAIWMNLALLPRAHTTVLAIQQFILSFSSRMCSNKLLRVDFHPTFTPRRHNFSLSYAQNRISLLLLLLLIYLKWFKKETYADMTPSVELEKPLRISYLKDVHISLVTINKIYMTNAIRVMIINYWILVTGRDLLHSSGK